MHVTKIARLNWLAVFESFCTTNFQTFREKSSASLGMRHGWATRVTCPGLYIHVRQLAGYPRTSVSQVTSDPVSRPSAAELSMATRPGQRTQLVESAMLQSGAHP